LSHPLQNLNTGRLFPIRPEAGQLKSNQKFHSDLFKPLKSRGMKHAAQLNPIWSPMDTLPRSVKIICLWFVPNGYVKELTLFLPRLALLQSPRTKYSIAWLEIFRSVTRHCHIWRTSMILPKISHQYDARREDLQNCTSQVNLNDSTTLQLHHQLPSIFCWSESQGEWRHQQLWPTMTLGWIGLTPNIACG
jgi:hypothetical protein